MNPLLQASGEFRDGKNSASFTNLPVFVIQEDNTIIYYCPLFDISGYGNNDNEAKDSLKFAIVEFFKYTMNKKTFNIEMKRLGWSLIKRKKNFRPPELSEMVKKHDFLSEIINEHNFRKETFDVAVPA